MAETSTIWQIVGVTVALAVPFAGALYGVFKYSVGRNVKAMDEKFDDLKNQVAVIGAKVDSMHQAYGKEGMTRQECQTCRKECNDRTAQSWREVLEWMRRQEDKMDSIVLMVANNRNGS